VSERTSRVLVDGPLVRAGVVTCRAPRSACGGEEWTHAAELIVPLRGVFMVHRGRDVITVDANSALALGPGSEYRVSHPASDGDECLSLVLSPELHEEVCGSTPWRSWTLRPGAQLHARTLLRHDGDGLAGQEAALALARELAAAGAPPRPLGPAGRRRVARAQALLAADPGACWRLEALAAHVGCSPYHLARQFRAVSGETIARYLLRLRLAAALERLAGGESDLARLAVDLGFAHHSHFSARARAVLGLPPSELRKIVTAEGPGPV
jgi:AraC family transcriptional regulator